MCNFFFSYQSPSSTLCTVFDSTSSNIDEVLLVNSSANVFATIVHRSHIFRLYRREKSSDCKVKFRQAINCCKRVLEASKLAYANKTKEPIDQLQILW